MMSETYDDKSRLGVVYSIVFSDDVGSNST